MNEERFTGKAELYKKFRPSYPKELIDYLYLHAGFNKDSVIADIGAGTGIFSRLLLERESKVYGVEPNDDMRSVAINDFSEYEKHKKFTAVCGNDKNTGLLKNSVDFITVAQAFHWFDRQLFKLECQRILKDNGKVVLIWNSRDDSSELVNKNDDIIDKYCPDTKGHRQRGGESPDEYADFFNGGCEYKTYRNDVGFDRNSFIGRNLSSSYSPKEETGSEKYRNYVKDLSDLFDEYNVNGVLIFSQITKSYIGRV